MISLTNATWTVLTTSLDPVPEPEDVNPGWIALIVVVSLIVVTVLLWLSLRKQLGRVNVEDDSPAEAPPELDVPADDQDGGSNPA